MLKNATCLSDNCWTNGVMIDTGRGYPALLASDTKKVAGELYNVTEQEL
ncbi:gamma-glutamylcyclotransferase [Bacillus sp. BGMRC 2118]|nr:gamma-glutamylcyclotransferase [Bacillus sp. BGMRC 2118]